MDDKDSIRVDLLKFRRKAFFSYPEGSEERKTFLKVILQNELMIAENEMPQDFINLVLEGDRTVAMNAIKHILLLSIVCTVCLIAFFKLWPVIHSLSLIFLIASFGCLVESGLRIKDYLSYRRSLKIVRQYSNDIKKQVSRISNDIKRLEGPHGF